MKETMMSTTAKILVAAAIVASTATFATAQSYYRQIPAEQQHWYDRNAIGQNV
jgi:hypothetical protein